MASSKTANVVSWILQILVALAFFAAAGAKFAGVPQMVAAFERVGLGQWFRYFTAVLELAGAIAVLIPRYSFYGAVLLAIVMVGAIVAEFTRLGESPLPAIVLLIFTVVIAFLRRNTIQGEYNR